MVNICTTCCNIKNCIFCRMVWSSFCYDSNKGDYVSNRIK